MHLNHPVKQSRGFANPPDLLIIAVVLSIIAAVVLPVAIKMHWGILPAVGMVLGGFGLFVLWLQHRNIIDWLRGRRWRDRKDR
jgi:protein-S-isoprenylcysteine O-methyltransferase Ste14